MCLIYLSLGKVISSVRIGGQTRKSTEARKCGLKKWYVRPLGEQETDPCLSLTFTSPKSGQDLEKEV